MSRRIRVRESDSVRFLSKVHPEPMSGCWLWLGALDRNGYGRFSARLVDGSFASIEAHRFAAQALGRARVAGRDIDHRCVTRSCVNPEHLEPCSHRVNNARSTSPTAVNARKTCCPAGHELERQGDRRRCKTCRTLQQRARRARLAGV